MKRKIFLFLIPIVGLLAIIATLLFYHHKAFYHFETVKPGVLYRSGTLTTAGLNGIYRQTHFKTIVILRTPQEMQNNENHWYTNEMQFTQKHNINVFYIPMNYDAFPTPRQENEFLGIVNNPKYQPVLVHCQEGTIRTGMMVSLYQIKVLHQSPDTVIQHIQIWHHSLHHAQEIVAYIKTMETKAI